MSFHSHRFRVAALSVAVVVALLLPHISRGAAPREPVVATLDARTGAATVRSGVLRPRFPNGTRITATEIVKYGKQFYLVRSATRAGQCQTTATPLDEAGGQLVLARRASGGYGSSVSCSGNPCSSCKFVSNKDGVPIGCDCRDSEAGHRCNHTITSTSAKAIFAVH